MSKRLHKWHTYCAIFAFIPIILMGITGSVLVFKTEIDNWLIPHQQLSADNSAKRISIDQSLEKIEQANPNYIVGAWEYFDDKKTTDRVYLIEKGTSEWFRIYYDPYQDNIVSDKPINLHDFFTEWFNELHYSFLLHEAGAVLGIIFALVLLFLSISGILLHKKFWKRLFMLRTQGLSVFFTDFHKMVGIFTSPVLLVVAFTGLYYNTAGLYEHLSHSEDGHHIASKKLLNPEISIQQKIIETQKRIPGFETSYILFAYEPDLPLTIMGDIPDTHLLASVYSSYAVYSEQDGSYITHEKATESSALSSTLDSFRHLHFGSFGGLPVKIIWFIVGLAPLILSITGVYVWYKRRKQKQLRRKKRNS